jgi:hypothetical protein
MGCCEPAPEEKARWSARRIFGAGRYMEKKTKLFFY